jgi:hypothetical protein
MNMMTRVAVDATRQAAYRQQVAERAAQLRRQLAVPSETAPAQQCDPEQARMIGEEALRYARRVLTRHVAWPSTAALDTTLLWCLHCAARDDEGELIWRTTPRLLFTSAERGSGKSTALDLVAILTGSRFGRLPKISGPAFAALVGKFHEVAVLDEARLIFGTGQRSQELQGMLLAGSTAGANMLVMRGGNATPTPVSGAVAYAGKDNLITGCGDSVSDLLDRSIRITMQRPARHYPDIDEDAERAGKLAHQGFATWAAAFRDDLRAEAARLSREACEAAEDESADDVAAGVLRRTQIWRPLRAAAAVLGNGWPERIDAAAAELAPASSQRPVTSGTSPEAAAAWLAELEQAAAGWTGEED